MAGVRSEGKSAFVRDVLSKDSTASAQAVSDAWKAAGREGTISDSLVKKMRADMGLTGSPRSGKKPADGNGASEKARPQSSARGQKRGPKPKAAGRARAANGAQAATTPVRQPAASSRSDDRVLEELEGDIDRLIFRLMAVGGMHEVEEALRRARRLLIRSQRG